ncbi:hypothetical protein B0T26DRAFT_753632 [Lasiosphaeria miniovina]|uniref:Uncharacterized protein n=1 Tax=Lasiosphaeria miniovina TaxID=1954250 RepID=A0AA40DVS0_9PEZI|nr:uncharacterized protein B0T26DRAFT_753632 [Lasiosphaeria miniovina]KAK0713538.1 hypothetical protein B0T26DRAFT_753632 [Lasiosphaeria miniovina]
MPASSGLGLELPLTQTHTHTLSRSADHSVVATARDSTAAACVETGASGGSRIQLDVDSNLDEIMRCINSVLPYFGPLRFSWGATIVNMGSGLAKTLVLEAGPPAPAETRMVACMI